jgi:hypothetical protein
VIARALAAVSVTCAIAITGCGHIETHHALLRAPQPKSNRPAELYMVDQAEPERPFYEIALVQAIGFGSDANPEHVARALTDEGATLGCDAVIRVFIDLGYTRAHASGVCVKYLAEGPAGPRPLLPPGAGKNPTPPPMRPIPAPRWEPLPSSPPSQGGGR